MNEVRVRVVFRVGLGSLCQCSEEGWVNIFPTELCGSQKLHLQQIKSIRF